MLKFSGYPCLIRGQNVGVARLEARARGHRQAMRSPLRLGAAAAADTFEGPPRRGGRPRPGRLPARAARR